MSLSGKAIWAAALEIALLLTGALSWAAGGWTKKMTGGGEAFQLARSVIVSPANTWAATSGPAGGIHIWRFDDGRLLRVLSSEARHPAIVATPNGHSLVAEVKPGTLQVVDTGTGRVMRTLSGTGPLEISRDRKRLIGRSAAGAPVVWELSTGRAVYVHDWESGPVASSKTAERTPRPVLAAVLPDARRILIFWRRLADRSRHDSGDIVTTELAYEETLTVHEIPSRRLLRSAVLGTRVVGPMEAEHLIVSVAADGNRLLVQTPGDAFLLWDLAGDAPPHALRGTARSESAHILPDGKRAVVWNTTVISLLDLNSTTPVWSVAPGTGISIVRLSAGGTRLAFGTQKGAISVVDIGTGQVRAIGSLDQVGDVAVAFAFSFDDRTLFVGTAWGAVVKLVANGYR